MANLVLGLFSPFKHELREYLGYDITKLRDNVRFLEILVNRGGSPGGIVALYFDGAVNYFNELPLPNDPAIQKVYDKLDKVRTNKVFFIYNKLKNNNNNLQRNKFKSIFAKLFNK